MKRETQNVILPPIQKYTASVLSPKAPHILRTIREGMKVSRARMAYKIGIDEHTLRSLERNPAGAKVGTFLKALKAYRLELRDVCK